MKEKGALAELLGIQIRNIRLSNNWSVEKLSRKSGVDRKYLSDIEHGRKNMSVAVLEKIAKAFDIKASELIAAAEK